VVDTRAKTCFKRPNLEAHFSARRVNSAVNLEAGVQFWKKKHFNWKLKKILLVDHLGAVLSNIDRLFNQT